MREHITIMHCHPVVLRKPSCSSLSVIIALNPFYANENLLTTEKSGLYLFNITTSLN
jgi:hypothetical protein